jgi:hypothetical protein
MAELERIAVVNPGLFRLGRLLLYFLAILHLLGCSFWRIGSGFHFCDDDLDSEAQCDMGWNLSWKSVFTMPASLQYSHALFFAMGATTGVGADIIPRNQAEFAFTALCNIVGLFMQALLIGSVPGNHSKSHKSLFSCIFTPWIVSGFRCHRVYGSKAF